MGDLALDAGPAAPAARPRRALDRHAHGNEAGPALAKHPWKTVVFFFYSSFFSFSVFFSRNKHKLIFSKKTFENGKGLGDGFVVGTTAS